MTRIRITISAFALALITALTLAASPANAAFCSTSGAGGEKTPALSGTDVTETGTQGYTCTKAWDADVQPMYETGGVWVYCNECAPGFHPNTPDQFWPANTPFNWPHTYGIHNVEGLVSWTPSTTADTPVCKVNWRLQVNFFDSTHIVFQSDVSPTLQDMLNRVMPEKIGTDQHTDQLYHVEPNGRAVTLATRSTIEARNGMKIQYLSPAGARRLAAMLITTADDLDATKEQ